MAAMAARKKPLPPLDKGWAWMIVLGVFIYVFFMVGIAKSYGFFLLAYKKHFDINTPLAAMPMSITAFVYALGAPTAILVAERITCRRVVIIGAIVSLIGVSLCSLLVSMSYIIVVYGFCVGIGNSCFYGNGLVMLGKYFRNRKSLATGLGLAGASIGQLAMPPIIEYLLETYGLSGTLLITGALYGHCAISGALFRPIEQYRTEEEQTRVVEDQGEEPKQVEDMTALIKTTSENNELHDKVTSSEIEMNIYSPENGGVIHQAPNGNVTEKENKVSIADLNSNDTKSLTGAQGDSSKQHEDKKMGKNYSEDIEEDEQTFVECKALLASTGSIFLVSQSILDVSVIDSKAHGLETTTRKLASVSGIKRIFDFTVLKSYITQFFVIVSFLCFFGYFNHILFLPAISEEKGFANNDSALLISICGAGDLIARIGTGLFGDLNIIPRYQLKATACLLSGINIFVFIYANTFSWLAFHCFCYGFLGGVYVCLMSVVLVDFVGVQLLAKNLAIVLLIQGIGAAVGQMFLGWVKDQTGTFDYVIIILSLNLVAGSLLLYCYHFVRRWEDARLNKVKEDKNIFRQA